MSRTLTALTAPPDLNGLPAALPTGSLPVEQPTYPAKLATALALAQQRCGGAAKDKTMRAKTYSYKYAGAEAILEAAKEALAETGLAPVLTAARLHVLGSGPMACYEMTRDVGLAHSSGEFVSFGTLQWPVLPDTYRPLDKAFAGAITTSLAYFLRDLLLMPRVDPTDDLAGRDDAQPRTAAEPPTASEAPPAPPAPPAAVDVPPPPPVQVPPPPPASREVPPAPLAPPIAAGPLPAPPRPPTVGAHVTISEEQEAELALLIRQYGPECVADFLKRFAVPVIRKLRVNDLAAAKAWLADWPLRNEPVNNEQLGRIEALMSAIGMSVESFQVRLAEPPYSTTLAKLTHGQAGDIIAKLEAAAKGGAS